MNKVYMQFSNCIAVKGYCKSIIYDLQRNRFVFIPNCFADLLLSNYLISLDSQEIEIQKLLDFLVDENFGIYIEKKTGNRFPGLKLIWDNSSTITNAIIDFDKSSNISNFANRILPQYEKLGCKNFQINFIDQINIDELIAFLSIFDNTDIMNINLNIPFVKIASNKLKELHRIQPRLRTLYLYQSLKNEKKYKGKIVLTTGKLKERNAHKINMNSFTINISLFSESQNFNAYFNRKLCIDSEGEIKNSPEALVSYGNIKKVTLKSVIDKGDVKKFWQVNKLKIDVCNDCEYRYMCVDSCPPIQRKNNTWYRSKECDYNPFISRWSWEKGYLKLKDCGVVVDNDGFTIDKKKLDFVNNKLWV